VTTRSSTTSRAGISSPRTSSRRCAGTEASTTSARSRITGGNFEIPLEIRTTYYPTTGNQLSQRGDFRQQPLKYNDQPNFQVMILVGFDYLFL